MDDSVALVKDKGNLRKTLEEGLSLVDGLDCLKSPVVIKPNICAGEDKTGFAVSKVNVIETLILQIFEKKRDLSVKIVESDSGSKFADAAFEVFGYKRLEENMRNLGFDVSLVNLSHSSTVPVKLNGLYFQDLVLPTLITEPNFFISVAVAKTHGLTFITGSLKNLFGVLPRKDQFVYHPHINEVIVDLNRIIRPDLCIVDARVGLEGWAGPKTRKLNAFIIGKKPVSVDATMARIMGFNPESIQQLLEAEKFNLGILNPTILGETVKSIKVQFNPPS